MEVDGKAEGMEDGHPDPEAIPRIRALDEHVVNKIAAGEVIQRPSSAIKEMLENSLDAGATQITVIVKDGGLKLLQIQDNGHGIQKEDLPILCHRHTTSKLREYEDLETIDTLGFRGEALASISYVSHMTVTTMTHGADHGYRVTYRDGEMLPPGPKPCAAVPGTTILVEDLFFNVPTRKRSFRSTSEEYNRILDIVGRYAVFKQGVSFSCKRQGESRVDLQVPGQLTDMERICSVMGSASSKDLLPVSLSVGPFEEASEDAAGSDSDEMAFLMEGFVSGLNHVGKKGLMILFINGRCVDCLPLRRAIEAIYTSVLPKATKPFMYMKIELPSKHIDVNVHPTKREVSFLHQGDLIAAVCDAVSETLKASNESREFTANRVTSSLAPEDFVSADNTQRAKAGGDKRLVRTDFKALTLDAFMHHPAASSAVATQATTINCSPSQERQAQEGVQSQIPILGSRNVRSKVVSSNGQQLSTAVQELVEEVKEDVHMGLAQIIREHTFVGVVDETLAFVQHKTRLYLVNTMTLSHDLFYQQALIGMGSFGRMKINPPVSLFDLMTVAMDIQEWKGEWKESDGPKDEMSRLVERIVVQNRAMLARDFSIDIEPSGLLCTLPVLLEGYQPDLAHLPDFVLGMGRDVEWKDEKQCCRTLATLLAHLYCVQPCVTPDDDGPKLVQARHNQNTEERISNGGDSRSMEVEPGAQGAGDVSKEAVQVGGLPPGNEVGREGAQCRDERTAEESHETGSTRQEQCDLPKQQDNPRNWTIQHVLFHAMRTLVKPPKARSTDGTIVQVAALEALYKIFERC